MDTLFNVMVIVGIAVFFIHKSLDNIADALREGKEHTVYVHKADEDGDI